MGHFLGLFHSTENPNIGVGRVYDNIDDSPKDSSNNLMYFNASNAGTAISNGQKEVIYRSLWVY